MEKVNLKRLEHYYWPLECKDRWIKSLFWEQKQKNVTHDKLTQRNQGNPQGKTQKEAGTKGCEGKEKIIKVEKIEAKNRRIG
jgi:hypothetical protein